MSTVGRYKLSQQLNITPMEAQSIMSRFLQDFPGIQQLANNVVADCRQKGALRAYQDSDRCISYICS